MHIHYTGCPFYTVPKHGSSDGRFIAYGFFIPREFSPFSPLVQHRLALQSGTDCNTSTANSEYTSRLGMMRVLPNIFLCGISSPCSWRPYIRHEEMSLTSSEIIFTLSICRNKILRSSPYQLNTSQFTFFSV
jgi:hypothetical protein